MTHREKVDRLVRELKGKGVGQLMSAPPAFRLLWALGIEIPPPFFIPFKRLAFLYGATWGIVWTLFMWVFVRGRDIAFLHLFWVSAIGSVFVGVTAAGYYRWKARRLKLSDWKDYDISK